MKLMKLCILGICMFAFCALLEGVSLTHSWVPELHAEVEGPLFKLRKPAKLHLGAYGASEVLEVVWKGATCVWLDKHGVWVEVRLQKTGRSGWIHHKYLMPASMQSRLTGQ